MRKVFEYQHAFSLELGGELPKLQIAYHTYGKLNTAKDNVVWVCHALTANSDAADWWSGLIGSNKLFDPAEYYIVCANIVGSCYGTTGPTHVDPFSQKPYLRSFPAITVRDIVNAHLLLKDHLEIENIKILIGGSLGGFQAIEWAVQKSGIIKNLILLATNARQSAWGKGIHEVQRKAIENDVSWQTENITIPSVGLKIARGIGLLHYRHYDAYENTQQDENDETDNYKVGSYINYQGDKLLKRFDPFTYWCLTKAMDTHNISRGRKSIEDILAEINSKTLVIGISSDNLCPPQEQQLIAQHIPNAKYKEIDSIYGHDGFLIEYDQMTLLIQNFLNE